MMRIHRIWTAAASLILVISAMSGTAEANVAQAAEGPDNTGTLWAVPDVAAARALTRSLARSESQGARNVGYIVQRGDTLYHIAQLFDTTVNDLMLANGLSEPRFLQAGSRLAIPRNPANGEEAAALSNATVEQVLSTTLTAYTAGAESTGKSPGDPEYGITYSGVPATEGRTVAVDPSVIPLGSTVYIEGIGLRTAEDIGSAVKGAHIDVFMNNLRQAKQFGVKKNIRVYVLEPEPRPGNYAAAAPASGVDRL